jgi:hypothetical protein
VTGAAAQIEDAFTRLRRKDVNQIGALFPDERMAVVVE